MSTGAFKITYQLLTSILTLLLLVSVVWTVINCSLADPLVVVVFFIVNLFLCISGVSLLTVSVFVLFLSTLFICVYLPTDYGNLDSQDWFAESLNELRGFIDSQSYDNMIVAGDFNVDFTRLSVNRDVLLSFVSDLDLSIEDMCDLSQYSYMRDDGLVSSWPDHILTSSCHLDNLTVFGFFQSLESFSDHLPLHFNIKFPNLFPALTTLPLMYHLLSVLSGLKLLLKISTIIVNVFCLSYHYFLLI